MVDEIEKRNVKRIYECRAYELVTALYLIDLADSIHEKKHPAQGLSGGCSMYRWKWFGLNLIYST
jgi:hypothetical protein